MPDPIDELEGFTMPTVTPASPSEVRRRGDRIRRRNNALAAVGGVAAVALIAAPLAVVLNSGDKSSAPPQPAPQPPGGWVQTVPADFDLGALPTDATFTFTVRKDSSAVDNIPMCGEWAFATEVKESAGPATDTWGAHFGEPGSDGGAGRTLAVYADDTAAQAALDGFRQAVIDCPRDEQGSGLPLVNDVVDVAVPGAEDAFVYTNQAKDGALLSDLTAFEVARVGNALYVANSFTSAGGPQARGTVDHLIANSAPVVDQMCAFSIEGCDASQPTESTAVDQGGLSGTIPDDFPLEMGLPTDKEPGSVGLEGPTHDLDLAPYNLENTLAACGVAPAGLPKPVDTLYAGHRTPAQGILRQLMTFGSVDDAQTYAENVIGVFASCPEDTDNRGVSKLYDVTIEGPGDYTASSVMRVEVNGEPGPGYQVVQVVRVGQAVLQTLVVNDADQLDGSTTPDDVRTMYLDNSQTVLDAMAG